MFGGMNNLNLIGKFEEFAQADALIADVCELEGEERREYLSKFMYNVAIYYFARNLVL